MDQTALPNDNPNVRQTILKYLLDKQQANHEKYSIEQKWQEHQMDEYDIHEFLQQKLNINRDQILHLEEMLLHENKKMLDIKENFTKKISFLNKQHELEMQRQKQQSHMLETKLAEMKPLEQEEKHIKEEIQNLKAKLQQNRVNHAKQALELDRAHIQMKGQMKRTIQQEIRHHKKDKEQMHLDRNFNSCKRERDRHSGLVESLQHYSKMSNRIMGRKKIVQEHAMETKQKLDISLNLVAKAKKKEISHQNKIARLQERLSRYEQNDNSNVGDKMKEMTDYKSSNTHEHKDDALHLENKIVLTQKQLQKTSKFHVSSML